MGVLDRLIVSDEQWERMSKHQKGDVPQAAALLQGRKADFVMADTAYDADHFRDRIAKGGAVAVIPNNPSRARKLSLDKALYKERHLVECCFSSSSSEGSQHVTRRLNETSSP